MKRKRFHYRKYTNRGLSAVGVEKRHTTARDKKVPTEHQQASIH
jgi:hypothetical protein